MPGIAADHGALMDSVYRNQRHVYDFTRKYYLFGRDRLIAELAPSPGASVVEIGCGTARNLIKMARLYPLVSFYGLDASEEMLATAGRAIARAGLSTRIHLAQGLAEDLSLTMFGRTAPFDDAVFSYSLSMIPDWKQSLRAASSVLSETGNIHIVDFGDLTGLGTLGRRLLRAWLDIFHVCPRAEILQRLESMPSKKSSKNSRLTLLPGRYAFLWRGGRGTADYLML